MRDLALAALAALAIAAGWAISTPALPAAAADTAPKACDKAADGGGSCDRKTDDKVAPPASGVARPASGAPTTSPAGAGRRRGRVFPEGRGWFCASARRR